MQCDQKLMNDAGKHAGGRIHRVGIHVCEYKQGVENCNTEAEECGRVSEETWGELRRQERTLRRFAAKAGAEGEA